MEAATCRACLAQEERLALALARRARHRLDDLGLSEGARSKAVASVVRARVRGVCGFLDSDGQDYCELPPGHSERTHYCYDPAGRIRASRPCLDCRRPTRAHDCLCGTCRTVNGPLIASEA